MKIENLLVECLKKESKYLYGEIVNIKNIKIQEKVRLQCFHCEKYEQKWTCPPRVDRMNFKQIFEEYDNAMIVYCKIPFNTKLEYEKTRYESTNLVHKSLLGLEKILYNNNNSLCISFIGGSCKLCKDKCSEISCRLPNLSRIPLEATGVNVIDFVKKELNLDIVFPLDKYMYRFGLLLW